AEDVLRQTKHHADAGACESDMPVNSLRDVAGDDGTQKSSEVDSHVKDRKAGIAPRVVLFVERTNHGTDVGFQQPRSDDDQRKTRIEEWQCVECQCEVTGSDNDAANQHASILT